MDILLLIVFAFVAWSLLVGYTTWLVRDCWTYLEERAKKRRGIEVAP